MRFTAHILATLAIAMPVKAAQETKPAEKPAASPAVGQPPATPPTDKPAAEKPAAGLPAKWPVRVSAAGEDIPGVCAKGTAIFKWSDGHNFTEGPACAPDGTMYFTDVPGGTIQRIDAQGAQIASKAAKQPFGLFFAKDGTLFCTDGGEQRIIAIDLAKNETRVVCDKGPGGAKLGKVNDLVLDRTGGIWFTAPVIGRKRDGSAPDAVYFVPVEGGEAVQVVRDDKVVAPNGVHLSPDGKQLYVLPYLSLGMMSYPIEGPGKLGAGKVLYSIPGGTRETLGGDGLTVDTKGNIFITVPARSAIFVLSPEGKPLGMIRVPERPSNCALGGKEGRTLYITAQTGVYSIDVEGARSR